jgi:hypothetical protein
MKINLILMILSTTSGKWPDETLDSPINFRTSGKWPDETLDNSTNFKDFRQMAL